MNKKIAALNKESSRISFQALEDFAREHVQGFIQRLLEEEVTELLGREKSARRSSEALEAGYRNGHGKKRRLTLALGTVELRRPRVRGLEGRFESQILPLFKRRSVGVERVLPELYLHGLAEGDFELALRGLLGEGAPISATSIARLKAHWQLEFERWRREPLSELEVVYCWADGIYVKAGLDDSKAALLVLVAALSDGTKRVLAVESGYRESSESWGQVLRDLKVRGLGAPRLLVADGHLGIWRAMAEVFPGSLEQRCWNHKLLNVLDLVPLKRQPEVRDSLRRMMYAASRGECERERKQFRSRYVKVFRKAVETLDRDWERMVSYYSFPKEHWVHLRTTNPVESPFALVRLRTSAGKRYKRVENATALIWKLLMIAEKSFRRLKGLESLPAVAAGAKYEDGEGRREQLPTRPEKTAA